MPGVPNLWVMDSYKATGHWESGHQSSMQAREASLVHMRDLGCMCETIPPTTAAKTAKAPTTAAESAKSKKLGGPAICDSLSYFRSLC